jgi:hypothetical protein
MEYIDIVNKLIGPIKPIGSSSEDEIRFKNLKELCHLANLIIIEIDSVAYENKDRYEHSMKIMAEYAANFLTNEIGIK